MGKVITPIKVENWTDIELLALGKRRGPPRNVETDALVDTGATMLYLKSSVIRRLGLRKIPPRGGQVGRGTSRTCPPPGRRAMSNRREKRRIFSVVNLEIQGRSCRFDVVELPDDLPNIIGQIPLEAMDWVVDMRRRKLVPNPEHKDGVLFDDF